MTTNNPLRFEPLREAHEILPKTQDRPHHGTPVVTEGVRKMRSAVSEMLDKENWLLEANQHIDLPSSPLDQNSVSPPFSLREFAIKVEDSVRRDLQESARDPENEDLPLVLNEDQTRELRERGQFTVPSALIQNQHHVWKIAPWFYSGRRTIISSFLAGLGAGLDHLLVYAWGDAQGATPWWIPSWAGVVKRGIVGPLSTLGEFAAQAISAPIQPPKFTKSEIQQLMAAAETGYVCHHLNRQGYDTSRIIGDGDRDRHVWSSNDIWNHIDSVSEIASKFRPSKSQHSAACRATEKVRMEQSSFAKSRNQHRRDSDIPTETRATADFIVGKTTPVKARQAAREDARKWQEKMQNEFIVHLAAQSDTVFQAEAARLRCLKIEKEVKDRDNFEIDEAMKEREAEIKKARPFLSLSKAWMYRKTSQHRIKLQSIKDSSFTERVAEKLADSESFGSQARERRLRVAFREQLQKSLHAELISAKANLKAGYLILHLDSKKWRLDERTNRVNQYKLVEVRLDQWFWRYKCFFRTFQKSTIDLAASSYHFFVSGPLSVRALFSRNSFYALKRPSSCSTSAAIDEPSSLTPTLTSRLRSFFDAMKRDREQFESTPDEGVIGKALQRTIFRFRAAVSAVIGVTMIVSFMVLGTILCSFLTGLGLVASPVVGLLYALLQYFFGLFVYDFRANTSSPLWKLLVASASILLFGVVQGIAALIRNAIVCPSLAMLHVSWATGRALLRGSRDFVSSTILFRDPKVPSDDSFLAKRTHGPGLASSVFYRLPVDGAKTCVDIILHHALVTAHINFRRAELLHPFDLFQSSIDAVVSPFGCSARVVGNHPSTVSCGIVKGYGVKRINNESPSDFDAQNGLWDHVSRSIRTAHPMMKHQPRSINQQVTLGDLIEYDKNVSNVIDDAAARQGSYIPLDLMSQRTGQQLANLHLRQRHRGKNVLDIAAPKYSLRHSSDNRLHRLVAIPSDVKGKFRLAEKDMHELWAYALKRTEECGEEIQRNLMEVAGKSEFKDPLEDKARAVSGQFWLSSGAQTPTDVSAVASQLIATILGGDDLLETLEEIDENLIIDPIFSSTDEHLNFWTADV